MKKNLILVFPGQGSQYVGMDKIPRNILGDIFVDNVWNEVNETLGYDLKTTVTKGPIEELTLTQNTQPALVTISYLYYNILKSLSKNFERVHMVLGHSLGEYSALLAAGVFDFKDCIKITHLRGKYMQEAVPAGLGAMYAILKCSKNSILEACQYASSQNLGLVSIANDNSPEQVVISGHKSACEKAVEWLQTNVKERFRAMPLQVSAPFHSSLMKPAAEKLQMALNDLNLHPAHFNYVSNIDAKVNLTHTENNIIKNKLVNQVCGTVKWVESCMHLQDQDVVIEVGPGAVLCGLIKKIHPNIKTFSMDQENFLSQLDSYLIDI